MPLHVLGIRHHGPGSAKSVREFLSKVQPDILLVEGPPEGDAILSHAIHADMHPPVAILAYRSDQPQQASFYPFGVFSPEWQAIQYGLQNNIPVRFMDMPLSHRFAMREDKQVENEQEGGKQKETIEDSIIHEYPLTHLARAAGYEDTELWWEHQFELRLNHLDSFDAILEGMTALRETLDLPEDKENDLREAYMRNMLAEAEKENENIVVVCGAWHAPALTQRPSQKADQELLKGLPKCKVETTWIPWTYNRLTFASGYGAGVFSPGWYHHIWEAAPAERGYGWLTKVARVFRENQMDTSTAHIIEAVRLADALASLRGLARPGLEEYNEATNTVLSFGDSSLLNLVQRELIIGHRMGEVPAEVPAVPLQFDLQNLQSKLRLKPSDEHKSITLDLRKELDLERSKLLHRLQLLEIHWGTPAYAAGKGTFKEQWNLHWEPEMMISTIEKGIWGNTIASAASAYVKYLCEQTPNLASISKLLEKTMLSDLPEATVVLMRKVDELAALSGDIFQLMLALPPLAQVSRYGDVRKTDISIIAHVLDSLVARICIGLPNACTALDDESATGAYEQVSEMNNALKLLSNEEYDKQWCKALERMTDHSQVHGMISGKTCRILSENSFFQKEMVAKKFAFALSPAQEVSYVAAWLEGFLQGSGTILLLDENLWNILNNWVTQLEEEVFIQLLPVLRRSFATFSKPERRKLGEKAKNGGNGVSIGIKLSSEAGFNHERASLTLGMVGQLLGIQA